MRIIAINGKSGSGQTTLAHALSEHLGYTPMKTCTTRPSRGPSDIDRIFLSEEEFLQKIKNQELIEFVYNNNAFYGIPKVDYDVVLNCESLGVCALRKYCFQNDIDFTAIYLDVAEEVLSSRMTKRGDPQEKIQERLQADRYRDLFTDMFDLVLPYNNCSLEDAIEQIISFLDR